MLFFVQLYRSNDQSDYLKKLSVFKSLVNAFDNSFGNKFVLVYTFLMKFLIFAPGPEVCEIDDFR